MWMDDVYKNIKRIEHPGWEGWKIIDRYKGIYKDYPEAIFQNAVANDALLQEYVRDFYETHRDVEPRVPGENPKPARPTKKRDKA